MRSEATIQISPIDSQVISRTRRLVVVGSIVQILAIFVVICFLSTNEALRRANFLAKSNSESIGLMIATGDLFQLKSIVSSFKNDETPNVWILNKSGEEATTTPAEDSEHPSPPFHNRIVISKNGLLIQTSHPLQYRNSDFGFLILQNKIRIQDWLILVPVFLTVTLLVSLVQSKSLRLFSMDLAHSISGLTAFFDAAKSEESLRRFASSRKQTSFREIESLASHVHSILLDIILGSEAEKQNEKYRAIAKITAHVAHDLRHPLSVFEAVTKTNDWQTFLQIKPNLVKSLARIQNMVDGLLNTDASRLIRLSPSKLTLGELVSEILPVAREKDVVVRCEGKLAEIHGMMDQLKLIRALHNLLFNAIEAGATEIVMRCNEIESDCLLEVVDNGPGIPDHFVSNLFVEGATFGKLGGSGLGLSSVKNTILSHRGSISYDRKNNHSVFSIRLPLISVGGKNPPAIAEEKDLASEVEDRHPPRVLIRLSSKTLESAIIDLLSQAKVDLLQKIEEIRSSDIIYTDDDDLVLLSMESLHVTTLRHRSQISSEEIARNIAEKYSLKVQAIGSKNGNT